MSGTGGAREQILRLLALVPMLHAHSELRLSEAARALEVTPEQLVRDLKVLFLVGRPGGYPDDLIDVDLDRLESEEGQVHHDGVIRVSNADYLDRPLRLTPTEASAMIVALRALRDGALVETRDVVDRVLAKLETAAAEGPGGRVEPVVEAGVDSRDTALLALADTLEQAAEQGRQVELTYYTPARDEESVRVVDPRGVETVHGQSYLDAFCHSAEAPRLFRLDRIAAARLLDTPISSEPQIPRDLSEGIFTEASDTITVRLRLRPQARWVLEYYPVERVRERARGVAEADLQVADVRWLTRLLLRLAPHAEVLSPPECVEAFTSAARQTLSLYDGGGVQ